MLVDSCGFATCFAQKVLAVSPESAALLGNAKGGKTFQ
jgi:hypothetical protein